jgi:hypothetical protein
MNSKSTDLENAITTIIVKAVGMANPPPFVLPLMASTLWSPALTKWT